MVLIIRIIVNTTFKNIFDKSLGLRFKSRAGQIGQNVANARHRCEISSKGSVLPGHNDAEWAPLTRFALRRITASIMKDLILIYFYY